MIKTECQKVYSKPKNIQNQIEIIEENLEALKSSNIPLQQYEKRMFQYLAEALKLALLEEKLEKVSLN